jgi:acyl-coenzyme A synthetase/AMP-(fatty) acid ligase
VFLIDFLPGEIIFMPSGNPRSLREALINAADTKDGFFWGIEGSACLADLGHGSFLGGHFFDLSRSSVILATRDQLVTALALIELDGAVRRLTLCPPDLSLEQLLSVARIAEADAFVSDSRRPDPNIRNWLQVRYGHERAVQIENPSAGYSTEWILLTSGTSGTPKLVLHSLASLSAAIKPDLSQVSPIVWGTFYNICRYGGLQILLRAVLGGASLVLSDNEELPGDYLARLAKHGVTHVLGTPTHWRRVLMGPRARDIAPRYVRLSGEIADQAILSALRLRYPRAVTAHAFASTETGVGFTVEDGLEGFPEGYLNGTDGDIKLKVKHGSLRVCSAGTATGYLGGKELRDQQDFVDTGDAIELRDGRYYFLGRVSGVINVGGQKVHPEEVETVINRHPLVEVSRVRAKKNPITGSIVIADVVIKKTAFQHPATDRVTALKSEILMTCSAELAKHKVPVMINIVPALSVGATGKLIRNESS